MQICRKEGRHLVWITRLRSSWTHILGSVYLCPAIWPPAAQSGLVGRVLFCGLAAPSLPRPQELNQGFSSLDSLPFSHNNTRSLPLIPRMPRVPSVQKLPGLASWPGSFPVGWTGPSNGHKLPSEQGQKIKGGWAGWE